MTPHADKEFVMELCLQAVIYQLGPAGRHHLSHSSVEGVGVQWDNNPKQCGRKVSSAIFHNIFSL